LVLFFCACKRMNPSFGGGTPFINNLDLNPSFVILQNHFILSFPVKVRHVFSSGPGHTKYS